MSFSNRKVKNEASSQSKLGKTEQTPYELNPPDLMNLRDAVDALNKYVAPVLQNIHFSIVENDEVMMVMVLNVETQKVIRYIPHEEVSVIGLSLQRLRSIV